MPEDADDSRSDDSVEPDAPSASVLYDPRSVEDLEEWGPVDKPIDGKSHTAGTILHRGPDGRSECGIWTCTPGLWTCEVTRDEFCHFLEGRATYVHDDGEVIPIEPGTVAFFPAGWTGVCRVSGTVRKVYMIR